MSTPSFKDVLIIALSALCLALAVLLYRTRSSAPTSLPLPGRAAPSTPRSNAPPETTPSMGVCTMEASICPDGTAVGRTGPNCEFEPCP